MSLKPEEAVVRYLLKDKLPEGISDWEEGLRYTDYDVKRLMYKNVYKIRVGNYTYIVSNKKDQLLELIKDLYEMSTLKSGEDVDMDEFVKNIKDSEYASYISPEYQIEGHYKDYYIYPI